MRRMGYFGDAWAVMQDAADELLHEMEVNEWETDDYGPKPRFEGEMMAELKVAYIAMRLASIYAQRVEQLFDGAIDNDMFLESMTRLKRVSNI